jgi:hypothetical protein
MRIPCLYRNKWGRSRRAAVWINRLWGFGEFMPSFRSNSEAAWIRLRRRELDELSNWGTAQWVRGERAVTRLLCIRVRSARSKNLLVSMAGPCSRDHVSAFFRLGLTEHLGGGGLDASLLALPLRRVVPRTSSGGDDPGGLGALGGRAGPLIPLFTAGISGRLTRT